MTNPSSLADVRGASRLVTDLAVLVTDVVETMHHNIARHPGILGRATLDPTRGITGFVYRRVRGVTRTVGSAIDAVLQPLEPLLVGPRHAARDAVVSALNGVLGDHLETTSNPLAIPMQLRVGGVPLPFDRAGILGHLQRPRERIVVMAHGLCMSDAMWNRQGHDHGQKLAGDLQADAVYLRYNSGRHVSTNGSEFASLLERMIAAWPVPVRDLVLVGHSMGGLVIRSACAAGESQGHRWMRRLRAIVFLGTPQHGAPLERGGHGVDRLFRTSPYTIAFSRLGRLRSAGITDLRHGSVLENDWCGRDRFGHAGYLRHWQPLPGRVPAFAIAGSLSKAPHPGGRKPRGDGLVPVDSAFGLHGDTGRSLGIGRERQWIAYGTGHLDLLASTPVYQQMSRWLRPVLASSARRRTMASGRTGSRKPRDSGR